MTRTCAPARPEGCTAEAGIDDVLVRLKHVNRISAGGRTYFYHRLTKERLPDGEAERAKRVLEINAGIEAERSTVPGTLGHAIRQYRSSPKFRRTADSTKSSYNTYLNRLERAGSIPMTRLAVIDVAWLYVVQDAMADRPRSADAMIDVLGIVFSFAIKRGWMTENPAKHAERLRMGKHYDPWPDVAIERFRAGANPRMVWGMEVALFTGQRRGDVLSMQWRARACFVLKA